MKRLIFCFDGTWNKLDASCPTNVVITAESIVPIARDGTVQQIFYHEGVGTKKTDRILGGVFGIGVVPNIADAYRTLIFNYTPGDEIYVFGFSRGAYSARSFVGLISTAGIVHRSQASKVNEAVDHYRNRNETDEYRNLMFKFRSEHSYDVCISDIDDKWRTTNCDGYVSGSAKRLQIAYLGVWDTVGALGIPSRYTLLSPFNRKFRFHDTSLSDFVRGARHAIAIDERRKDFAPTLWENVDDLNVSAGATPDAADAPYQEKWFPGTHSSVGGGGERRGLSDQALAWVLDGAQRAGLELDSSERSPIYDLKPNPREFIADTPSPGLLYVVMNRVSAADRLPGPTSLGKVSMNARRRWKECAENLADKVVYRPGTLKGLSAQLDALTAQDVGLEMPTIAAGSYELYVVRKGDHLRKIAKEHLGSADRASEIFAINRDKLEDENRIFVGDTLRLPTKDTT